LAPLGWVALVADLAEALALPAPLRLVVLVTATPSICFGTVPAEMCQSLQAMEPRVPARPEPEVLVVVSEGLGAVASVALAVAEV
jgi:hypothetical protein